MDIIFGNSRDTFMKHSLNIFMDSMSTSEFPTVESLKNIKISQIMNLCYY